jgi:hypothetical protein
MEFPLHCLTFEGNAPELKAVLEADATSVNEPDKHGATPLQIAAMLNHKGKCAQSAFDSLKPLLSLLWVVSSHHLPLAWLIVWSSRSLHGGF